MPDNLDEKAPKEKAPEKEVKEEVVEEEVEEKETPEEKAPEKEETEEKPVEEEFDVEEFKEQTKAETKKEVLETLKKGFGLTEDDKKVSTEEGLIPPWEKRGEEKPKSWKEVTGYAADLAEWKRQKQEDEIAKVQEENEKEAKEVNKRWNDYWDSELKELTDSGELPKVKDEKDPNDLGKRTRIRLFAKMQEIGLERQKQNLPPITSVELVFRRYKDEILSEPPGADAPVSFGRKGVGTENKDDYTYDQIHNKSFTEIKDQG